MQSISSCYIANNALLLWKLESYRIYLITTSSLCFHVNEKWINLDYCCLCAFDQIFSAFDMKIHLCSFRWLGHNFRIKLYHLQTDLQNQDHRQPYNSVNLHKLFAGFYFRICIHGLNQKLCQLLAPYF